MKVFKLIPIVFLATLLSCGTDQVCEVNHINIVVDDKNVDVFASVQANDDVEQYNWKFSDGFSEASMNPWVSHSFIQDGDYVVELTVDLDHGNSCILSEAFNINQNSVSIDTCDINIVQWNFTGWELEAEVEIDGNPNVDVWWDFGDGSQKFASDESETYKYLAAGTYTVGIKYEIPNGCSDSTTKVVIID
jgi:PKD repeat protein